MGKPCATTDMHHQMLALGMNQKVDNCLMHWYVLGIYGIDDNTFILPSVIYSVINSFNLVLSLSIPLWNSFQIPMKYSITRLTWKKWRQILTQNSGHLILKNPSQHEKLYILYMHDLKNFKSNAFTFSSQRKCIIYMMINLMSLYIIYCCWW